MKKSKISKISNKLAKINYVFKINLKKIFKKFKNNQILKRKL